MNATEECNRRRRAEVLCGSGVGFVVSVGSFVVIALRID